MGNTTNSLADKSRLRQMIDSYGVPRMIITGFLLLMFVLVPFAGVDFATQISNVINRFSWNAIMVLAMVPMVHSGCGLNFGLPLGIISGLLGATLSIELGFTGPMSFVMAIVIATPFALLLEFAQIKSKPLVADAFLVVYLIVIIARSVDQRTAGGAYVVSCGYLVFTFLTVSCHSVIRRSHRLSFHYSPCW